jgi:hypothetical protein
MMTEDDIRTELGWTDSMIHSLLQNPDSPNARRDKLTGGYTYGLYHRDRVLAVAQSTEGRAAKRRWDETLRGNTPNPGWTTRLGDIGRALGITAVAVGRMLELLGYRVAKHVTDRAVAVGCGVHGGMVSRCTMIGTWSVWSPPSDRQPKLPANRKSLMRLPRQSQNSRQGNGWRPASGNGRRLKRHIGKRRRR